MDSSDDASYEAVFSAEYPAIVRTAYLITRDTDTAHDVAQDAFADMFVRWRRIRRYERPGAWVRMVAVQRSVRAAKRADRHVIELRDRSVPPDDPTGRLDVVAALGSLTAMQRAAVVLHYLEDRSVNETADALGCRPSTASVHLHRARARLAAVLGPPAPIDTEAITDAG